MCFLGNSVVKTWDLIKKRFLRGVRRDRRRCLCRRPSRRFRGHIRGRHGSSGLEIGRVRCTARLSASLVRSGNRGVDEGAVETPDDLGGPSNCRTVGDPTTTIRGDRPDSGGPRRVLAPSCSGFCRTSASVGTRRTLYNIAGHEKVRGWIFIKGWLNGWEVCTSSLSSLGIWILCGGNS